MNYFSLHTCCFLLLVFSNACSDERASVPDESPVICEIHPDIAFSSYSNLAVCSGPGNKTFLTLYDKKNRVQLFFDDEGKEAYRVQLSFPDSLMSTDAQFSTLAISPDSILACPMSAGKSVFLFNGKAQLLKTISSAVPLRDGMNDYVLVALPQSPLLFDGDKILAVCTRLDVVIRSPEARKKYFSTPPYILLAAKNGESLNAGYWPEEYRAGTSFRDFYPQHCVNGRKQIVFGFAASDSLFVMANGKITASYSCKSKYMSERHPFPDDSIGHFSFLNRYEVNEPRYLSLVYDPFRHCYYRLVHHAMKFENENGMTTHTFLDKPWSFMILDENFNLIGEKLMDAQRFLPCIFPVKDGLLVLQRKGMNGVPPVRLTLFRFKP